VVSPTITPPIKPGPAVAAIASTSFDQSVQDFQMCAAGDFRHHAAIGRVGFGLAEDDAGQDLAGPGRQSAHHRRRGLVATGFQA
jgi:hypothetical protein